MLAVFFYGLKKLRQLIFIKKAAPCALCFTNVITNTLTERIIAIYLVFAHRLVSIANANIRATQPAGTTIKAGTFRNIKTRNFCRNNKLIAKLANSEQRTYLRRHLITLFCYLLL